MRAEHGARDFELRNMQRNTQIAIIRRFCRKIIDISLPLKTFSRLNALFIALCVRNVVHAISSVGTRPDARKSQSFFDFFQNYALFLSRLRYSRRLYTRFTSFYMQNVVYAFSSVERRPNTRKSQSFVDFFDN